MAESIKDTLLNAFRQLLRPLVRILLRHGIAYDEFAETAKIVFVEVAERDFGLPERRADFDRIAIVTGLSDREVSRVHSALTARQAPTTENLNRVGRLLSAWHQDPAFTGPYGLPLELEFSGSSNSFSTLVQRYADGMPPQAMLDELKHIGGVSELPGGKIRVVTRSYIPQQADHASIQFMGVALRDLAETLDYNLNEDLEGGYFERRVWTPAGIDPRDAPLFDELVNTKGMEFLETLDNWLTAKESEAEALDDGEKARVGVGVYLFSDIKRSFREHENTK